MVNSFTSKIIPKFMSGSILFHPEPSKINFREIMVISNTFNNKYMFAVKINEIIKSEDNFISLHVNKNKSNLIRENDIIQVIQYEIPQAETITIYVKNSLAVPNGNWGTLISEQLIDQVIDIGDEIIFTYPSKNPLLVSATIKNSLPNSPIKITQYTNFIINKIDANELFDFKLALNSQIEARVNDYMSYLDDQLFDIIAAIKNDETHESSHAFQFEADTNGIILGIKTIFRIWDLQNETINNYEDTIMAGFDFTYKINKEIKAFAEVNIFSKNNIGTLKITIYTIDSKSENYLKQILDQIKTAMFSSKFRNTTVDDNCPGCGGKIDLTKTDSNGFVRCSICNDLIQLSAKYRLL